MPDIAFVNDAFLPLSEARVSVEDRGFQFGDGVYELIRVYGGKPFRLSEHLARLERSAKAVGIAMPFSGSRWTSVVTEALQRSGYAEAKIYIQLTRGAAPRDHAWAGSIAATVVVTVRELVPPAANLYTDGVGVITVPDIRWGRCDIKSICLLPNVLAKQQAKEAGAFEALFVRDGHVLEGATSNVFTVQAGTLVTSPEGPLLLSGVTRKLVLAVAQKAGVPAKEQPVTEADLAVAAEVFLAGTTVEVLPVAHVNGKPVGRGKPGPVTQLLMARFGDARA